MTLEKNNELSLSSRQIKGFVVGKCNIYTRPEQYTYTLRKKANLSVKFNITLNDIKLHNLKSSMMYYAHDALLFCT